MLTFGVAVAVGLLPLFGRTRIRGFSSVLDLFPEDLQFTTIPLASLLMGTVALVLRLSLFSKPASLRRGSRRWLRRSLTAFVFSFVALVIVYSLFVVRIRDPYTNSVDAVVIGVTKMPNAPCVGLTATEYLGGAGPWPTAVGRCWGDFQPRLVSLMLSLLYMAMMTGFAALVSLLVMQQQIADSR
jgi:hypothetical protein